MINKILERDTGIFNGVVNPCKSYNFTCKMKDLFSNICCEKKNTDFNISGKSSIALGTIPD